MGATAPLGLKQVAGLTPIFRISVVGSLCLPFPLSMVFYLKQFGTICSIAFTFNSTLGFES